MNTKDFGMLAADILEQSIGQSKGMSFPQPPMVPQQAVPQAQAGIQTPPMEPFSSTLSQPPAPQSPPIPAFYKPPPVDYTQPQQPPAFMTLNDSMPPPLHPNEETSPMGPLRRASTFDPKMNQY